MYNMKYMIYDTNKIQYFLGEWNLCVFSYIIDQKMLQG